MNANSCSLPQLTAEHIAKSLGPLTIDVLGRRERVVDCVRPIDKLVHGCLSYLKEGGKKLNDLEPPPQNTTIICSEAFQPGAEFGECTFIRTSNPRLAFLRAIKNHFAPRPSPPAIDPSARVDPSAVIDKGACIGAFCWIGPNCVIGAGTVLHPHVVIYANVRIGANVVIHAGTAIGADGFGYERTPSGELEKFPHIGGVLIEEDVEIGSNTSIDRGTLADTIIRQGARIDNQVHVAHNVVVGRHAAVIAQSMIGGSARIGDRSWLAPSSVIMNQVNIGVDATVGLGAVVVKDVPDGATVMGSPAVSADEFKLTRSALRRLIYG